MRQFDYVIIGNGAAGVSGCEGIRKLDQKGTIAILSDEPVLPYIRCLLPDLISGRVPAKNLTFRPEKFYEKSQIELMLGKRTVSIDVGSKQLLTDDGEALQFGRLLIATGSSATLPESSRKNLEGVFTLRTMEDAEGISRAAAGAKRAVILGGGLVGLESAIALRLRGLEVCVVVASEQVLSQNIDRSAAGIVKRHLEDNGIRILIGTDVLEILGEKKVEGARLSNEAILECDLIVSAKGVRMNTELAENAGISVGRGIMVDERMRTNVPDIYAAGDVAQARELISGRNAVMTVWPVAAEQGRVAGMNMAGGEMIYQGGLQINTVDFLGLPIVSMGETREPRDLSELKFSISSHPERKSYRKLVLRDGKIIGVILIGDAAGEGSYTSMACTRIDVRTVRGLLLGKDLDYAKLAHALLVKDANLKPSSTPTT